MRSAVQVDGWWREINQDGWTSRAETARKLNLAAVRSIRTIISGSEARMLVIKDALELTHRPSKGDRTWMN